MKNNAVKRFMKENRYSGYTCDHGIRKDDKRGTNWDFKSLEHVLKEFNTFKNAEERDAQISMLALTDSEIVK
jgi:hypothetical protein